MNNDSFYGLPVTSAQCIIGTEKYPDAAILLNYINDVYSQGYAQIEERFRALRKNDILQPYTSLDNFRSSSFRPDDVGYNLYVFDIRYQQNLTASQPIEIEFKFDGFVPKDINGYALVLANKLVSISSDGRKELDLI